MRAGIVRHDVPWGALGPAFLRPLLFAIQSRWAVCSAGYNVLGAFGVQSPPDGVFWVQSVHRAWIEISAKRRSFSGRLKQRCNPFHAVALGLERHYFGGKRYRKLIALTEDVRADLMRIYGVPAEHIVVIPNGFSREEFNLARCRLLRPEMRRKYGFSDSDRVIAFVANEMERKGFIPLLQAVALLGDPTVRVLAAGRLDPRACATEIARLGLTRRVTFTGPTNDVAASCYSAADLFALPTSYEAWGLVIVEAMACGLPALTSRLAGAAIAIEEGSTGRLLDDPRDIEEIAKELQPLLNGEHSSRETIEKSVGQYAWDRILLDYERILIDSQQG